MERIQPTDKQLDKVSKLFSSPTNSALDISELGTGKTVCAIELGIALQAQSILVVAPLGTRDGWERTAKSQGLPLSFKHIKTNKGSPNGYYDEYVSGVAGIYFVGTELFNRWSWEDRKRKNTWQKYQPDLVVFDEAHRASNRTSKTYKALQAVTAGYKLALSGTPTGNSWEGAWSVARWLFPDQVEGSFWRWAEQWCSTEYDPFSHSKKKITGEKEPGEFYNSLPCVVKLVASDISTDQVSVTYTDHVLPMLPDQRKVYERFERDLAVYLEENFLTTQVPIAHRIRLRQIALGVPKITEEDQVDFDENCQSAKIEQTIKIIRSQPDKSMLIGTHSSRFAVVLAKRIAKVIDDPGEVGLWNGDVSHKDRAILKKKFADKQLKYLVSTIPSMAEGIDGLQYGTNNILLVSRDDNRMLMDQFIGRINRRGQPSPIVRVHELKTEGSIDEGIFNKQITETLKMRKSLDVG